MSPLTPNRRTQQHVDSLRALRTALVFAYGLVLLVAASGLVWLTVNDYRVTIDALERQQLQLARSLDEHATRTLISVEQAMQNIVERLETMGGVNHADEYPLHIMLRDKIALTPQTRGIITVDENGILRAHGLEYPTRQVSLADRDYFIYHRTFGDLRLRIDRPVVSRTDNRWLIPVTRRINAPDGAFAGLVLAGVEPDYFLNFYQSLKLDPSTHIEILRSDGMLLLNYPFEPNQLGENMREANPIEFERHRQQHISVFTETDNQHATRLKVFLQSKGDLPLIVRVSINRDEALAKFRHDLLARTIAVVALILIVTLLLYLLLRQLKHVEGVEARLFLTQFTVDESPDIVVWANQDARIQYANRAAAALSGHEQSELLGTPISSVLPDVADEAWQRLWSTLTKDKRTVNTTRFTGVDAQHLPVEITWNFIEFNAERYACATVRDITERQNAERELRRHRDHLQELVLERTAEVRTVLDASPLAIMLTVNDTVRLVNPAFEALFGHEGSELIGLPAQSLYESLDKYAELSQLVWTRIRSGGIFRGEVELYRRDHSSFWAMIYAKAIEAGDRSKGVIHVIEDVTAQRIAAQSVRQSERLKRTIIESTGDGFILLDTTRRISEVNQAFCTMIGFRRELLIGQDPRALWGQTADLLFPELAPEPLDVCHDVSTREVTMTMQDGSPLPCLISSAVINDDEGRFDYAFAFLTDISHLKEVERSLFEAKVAAEEANIAKSAFLANMSHELRTPMHAILSFSEMGIEKLDKVEPAQLARYFERIHTSGRRLLVLVNDLLDMSKLEANRMNYDKAMYPLSEPVHAAEQEIASLLAQHRLTVSVDSTTASPKALFDRARVTQVLVNLLSNAIKFSPDGSMIEVNYLIDTQLANGAPAVGLTLRDHGPGIPEGEEESIFDKFIQSSRRHHGGGTGLGLAICRQIVADHGGEIFAGNAEGGGALFTVLLPTSTTTVG
ncbi:PAS domain S-box protein [Chitinibacteraceae bacterium HSL-7]